MSYADMVDALRRAAVVVHGGGAHPEAGRRGDHRLRARRRLRAGAVRRLAGRRRGRQARPAGDPARHHPRRRRHPAAARGSSGPARAKDLIFTGRFVDADEALRDRPGRPGRAGRRGVRRGASRWAAQFAGGPAYALRAAKEAIDRGPRDRPRHRPGDRAAAVRGAVRHRGPRDRHDVVRRERAGQGRVRGALTADAESRDRRPRSSAPGTTPSSPTCSTTTGRRTTYDEKWSISYDERCIDYARDRFAAVAGTRRLAVRPRRSRSAAAPASSCSTSCRPACSTRATSPTSRPGMVAAAHAQRRGPRARRRRAGSPTPSPSRTTTRPSTSSSGTPCCTTSRTSSSRCARCCGC